MPILAFVAAVTLLVIIDNWARGRRRRPRVDRDSRWYRELRDGGWR